MNEQPRRITITTTAPGRPHIIEVGIDHIDEEGGDAQELFADGQHLPDAQHGQILGGRLMATGRDQHGSILLLVDMTGVTSERPSFHHIMMNMAQLAAQRSTCLRLRVGTVIASTDFRKILAMGYNGNASGLPNECDKKGTEGVGACGCLHSEENAIINCDVARSEEKVVFVTHLPCVMCAKRLINLGGVRHVYYLNDYRLKDSLQLLHLRGIAVSQYVFPSGDRPERMIHHLEPNRALGVEAP